MKDHMKIMAEYGKACEVLALARVRHRANDDGSDVYAFENYVTAIEVRTLAEKALTDVLHDLEAEIES